MKTHSSYKRASPPVQQITGVHGALIADSFEVWRLSFIPGTFVVVSFLKGYVRIGQLTWREMRMRAPLSSVCLLQINGSGAPWKRFAKSYVGNTDSPVLSQLYAANP